MKQRSGFAPAREKELVAPVVVTVESGHSAADEELEFTVISVVEPGGRGFVDKAWCAIGGLVAAAGGQQEQGPEDRGHDTHARIESQSCDRSIRGQGVQI